MRLIDADRLKFVLDKNFGGTSGAVVLANLIDMQPTAYDVDVVVRELESKIELSRGLSKDEDNAEGMFTISELFYRKGLKEAIEIVRGGRNE